MYYHTCKFCGANLDPGEKCDCQMNTTEKKNAYKRQLAHILNKKYMAHNGHCNMSERKMQ